MSGKCRTTGAFCPVFRVSREVVPVFEKPYMNNKKSKCLKWALADKWVIADHWSWTIDTEIPLSTTKTKYSIPSQTELVEQYVLWLVPADYQLETFLMWLYLRGIIKWYSVFNQVRPNCFSITPWHWKHSNPYEFPSPYGRSIGTIQFHPRLLVWFPKELGLDMGRCQCSLAAFTGIFDSTRRQNG